MSAPEQTAREANRALLQALIDAGIGSDQALNLTVGQLTELLRDNVPGMTALDPLMSNLLTSTAGVLETLNNRVRRLWDENAELAPPLDGPADAPPEEAEA